MKSVYIFGPIHLFGESYIDFYKQASKLASQYFKEVVATYPDFWDTGESPREFYTRTYEVITKLDLFIGEVTSPSWGVGMEFQMAQEHNIPCIAICKKGNEPSSMILGIPCLDKVIYYEDIPGLINQLKQEFEARTK